MCRRFEGKPFTAAPPPDLPADHVYEEPPFTYPGIDFAGPLYINSQLTGQQEKAHCCLFTCASTCAIHLELTESLTLVSFLQAFRPFMNSLWSKRYGGVVFGRGWWEALNSVWRSHLADSRFSLKSFILWSWRLKLRWTIGLWQASITMRVGFPQLTWPMVAKLRLPHARDITVSSVHSSR